MSTKMHEIPGLIEPINTYPFLTEVAEIFAEHTRSQMDLAEKISQVDKINERFFDLIKGELDRIDNETNEIEASE